MKKILIAGILGIVLLLAILPIHYYQTKINNHEYKELTPSQIKSMIELGLIKINPSLPENKADKFTEVKLTNGIQVCSLYKDIFGRYYCRWA